MENIESLYSNLLDDQTSKALISEANDNTVPTGTYRLDVVKKEFAEAGEKSPWPGRLIAKIQADAFDKENRRLGRLFFDASPVEMRHNDKLDGPTRLWGNIAKVVGEGLTNREILANLGLFPVSGFVTRSYKTDLGWRTPKTADEEKKFKDAGFEPRNYVQNIRPYKVA